MAKVAETSGAADTIVPSKSVRTMMVRRSLLVSAVLYIVTSTAIAQVTPYPAGFRTQEITTNGATLHVRVGGSGPAVVLLHGFGDTGDMWAPLATVLVHDHTVIVPDLRGMRLSSHPTGGYDKKTEAGDIAGVMAALHVQRVSAIGRRMHTNHARGISIFTGPTKSGW